MTVATKFIGARVARRSFSVKGTTPSMRIESIARWRFPYSWRTPFGFPVVPEV